MVTGITLLDIINVGSYLLARIIEPAGEDSCWVCIALFDLGSTSILLTLPRRGLPFYIF
jgi:hypothetical protein